MDSYNKTVWVNGANPPINAENLNHIESGIEAVNQAVTAAEGRITTSESKIGTLEQEYQTVDQDLADIMDEMMLVEKTGNKVNIINPAAPSNTDYPTTTAVVEYVNFVKSDLEDYVDEHPISGAEKFVEVTDTSDTVVDNCTDPDTVYIVKVVSGVVTTTKMRVICTPNVAGQMAQYAMTKDGYIISRKFTASKWGAWDFIPDSERVAAMILAAITGKADKANSLSGYGITNAYNKTEVDYALAHKANKSTTLAGYGITDAYTKSEVDELITDTEKTPDYIKSEAARLAEVVRGHQGAGTITFIAASDFHDNIGDDKIEAGNKHALQAVKLLCERLKIDFVCGLGDYTWCAPRTNTTHSKGKSEIMAMVNGLINSASGKPMFLTTGNHDPLIDARHTEDSNGQYVYINPETDSTRLPIQAAEMFPLVEIYNCYNSKNSAGYGYKDFENYKLRVICLNTTDVTIPTTGAGYYNTNAVGMSTEQAQWFANSLDLTDKEDCAEWKTIVVSHFPLDWGGLIPLVKIIKAFEDGTSGSISFGGGTVTYDYNGKNAAQIAAQFHGHVHGFKVDNLHYFDDNSVLKTVETQRIAIPNACFYRTNEYGTNGAAENNGIEFGVPADGTTYAKTANTANDTAFNVVTLDFANRKIYADSYGAGYNREITIPEWSFVPVVIPDYMKTDYIPTATDDSGSILNGVGYIDGKRLSTSGKSSDYRDVARCTTSGYIPIEGGNTLHFGGSDCVWTSTGASNVWSYSYIYLYDENKAPIAYIVTDQGATTPAIPLDEFNYYSAEISPSTYTWKNSNQQTVNDLSGVRYCRVTVEGQGVNLRAYIE